MLRSKALFILSLLIYLTLFSVDITAAQDIRNFEVKEYITGNGTLAILALDSLKEADDKPNGTFRFIINGFENDLDFRDGVALFPQTLSTSTFVFLKHNPDGQEIGKYYYIMKKGKSVKTLELNGITLLLVPLFILFVAYIFKRFLLVFVLLGIVFLYFYFSQGLDVGPFMDNIFFSLKKLVV
ncbi:MAG TPA: hypothetical protein VK102_07250 [Sphingobacterium sp.]|nr:hypothetical protein [Sphingobacterium sp.]